MRRPATKKIDFAEAVINYAEDRNPITEKRYCEELEKMAETISAVRRLPDPDMQRELMLYAFEAKLHTKAAKEQGGKIWSYYYTCLFNRGHRLLDKHYKHGPAFTFNQGDNLMQEQNLKSLSWNLDDYTLPEETPEFDIIKAESSVGKKRGRKKTKAVGERADYWELAFKTLVRKGTMTEGALKKMIPADKAAAFANIEKAIKTNLFAIARREGAIITTANNGVDTIYMVVGK